MARPTTGDATTNAPLSPFQTPPNGMLAPTGSTPFNYTNQPNIPAPAVASTPTPRGLLKAFQRRWILGTFIGALVATLIALGIWFAMPAGKHQARAYVQIQKKQMEFLTKNQEDFEAYRRQQVFMLRTRDLFTRVLAQPAVSSLDMVKMSEDPVQMLEDQIRVAVVAPETIEITLTGNNLDDMKVLLDRIVKQYLNDTNSFDQSQTSEDERRLEENRIKLQNEIDLTNKQIEQLLRQTGAAPSVDGASAHAESLRREIATHESQFIQLRAEINQIESTIAVLKEAIEKKEPVKDIDAVLVKQLIAVDPEVVKAKKNYTDKKKAYDADFEKAPEPENNPFIKELKAGVDKAEAEVKAAEDKARLNAIEIAKSTEKDNREKNLAMYETRLKIKNKEKLGVEESRTAAKRNLDTFLTGTLSVDNLKESLKPLHGMLAQVQTQSLQLKSNRALDRVRQRGEADPIRNTNQNKKIALSAVGGLVSFFAVILMVAFLEWRTRRVDGVDQVVNELGMRVIGTVPAFPNRANLKAAVEAGGANWRFVLNESINSTRTMLLHTTKAQAMQVVMVTSATQGEGKTSITSQLATSMATAGMRTLIVDCDLRNPSIMKLFELPLTPGVSEVLRQEVDVADAVQTTAVPNLWIIPAGQCSNATIAALAQGHPLETLFNRLRGQFDFVIVDSCPVLPVADALLIAQHVDGVVFSIMQDISQLPKVITASEKLSQLNIPLVGAVVNGIKQDVYSYGYNYVKQLPA